MDDIEEKLETAYSEWRDLWDLDEMTLRDIYEAGFRHGVEAAIERSE